MGEKINVPSFSQMNVAYRSKKNSSFGRALNNWLYPLQRGKIPAKKSALNRAPTLIR